MAQPTPAVLRAASVIDLLAAHPQHSFTLTDLLKAIPMNKATLHALLAALEKVGYIYRASDKSYSLGPALSRIARTALATRSPLQAALPEMRSLANRYDVVCSAIFRNRDELVVRERAASASHLSWAIAPNSKFLLRPPLGSVFLAWSSKADIDRWLSKLGPGNEAAVQKELKELEFARQFGFTCGVRVHAPSEPDHFEASSLRLSDTDFLSAPLVAAKKYTPAFLSAPVFDERRQLVFALVMIGFGQSTTGTALERIGRELRAVCDRITFAIGGEAVPPTDPKFAIPVKTVEKRAGRPRKTRTAAA